MAESPAATQAAPIALPANLLATKLHIPALRTRHVERPRLGERLAEGMQSRLMLLVAPAGFGKTTLLSQACATQTARVVWLALDSGDNDPIRFWTYLAIGLDRVVPGCAAALLPLIQPPQLVPEAFIAAIQAAVADIANLVLVLDDYHTITNEAIHASMGLLLDQLPPPLHVVIASRVDPPLPIARMRARGQLTELRAADLRFTAAEAELFLQSTMGLKLTHETMATLAKRTEGWAAGLQLAALAMRDRTDQAGFIASFAGSNRAIADYLAEEVIASQPAEIQHFLMMTSVLDRMCGALCEALLLAWPDQPIEQQPRIRHAADLLSQLDQANLFVVALDDDRHWYRYHQLFAEMLRDQLRRKHPELMNVLHRQAAGWYQAHGYYADAIDHLLAAGEFLSAADILEQTAPVTLWNYNEVHTLLGWLDAFPEQILQQRPGLMITRAWGLLARIQIDAVDTVIQAIEAQLEEESPPDVPRPLLGQLAALRSYVLRVRGVTASAIETAQRALQLIPADDLVIRNLVLHNLYHAHIMLGEIASAEQALNKMNVRPSDTSAFYTLTAILSRSWLLKARGRLHEAYTIAEEALRRVRSQSITNFPSVGLIHATIADILCEWNDQAGAEHHATIALELGKRWWNNDILVHASQTMARLYEARRDRAAAIQMHDSISRMAHEYQVPWILQLMQAGAAFLAINHGDVASAERWAATIRLSLTDTPTLVHAWEYLALARLATAQGRATQALPLLDRLLVLARAGEYTEREIDLLKQQALALASLGQTTQAIEKLSDALRLAEPGGYLLSFVEDGPAMRQLLLAAYHTRVRLPEREREPDDAQRVAYLQHILAAFGQAPIEPEPLAQAAGLDEPLTPRERDVLRLLVAGQSNPEIAQELVVAPSTVHTHIKSIYAKLSVRNRVQATEKARQLKLL